MRNTPVKDAEWRDNELVSISIWNWAEYRWEHVTPGPLSCECDACSMRMVGQHDKPLIRNRVFFGLDSGLQA